MVASTADASHADQSKEYLVKAGFIYNFTKFVSWPEMGSNFTICLTGQDNFGAAIMGIEKKSTPSVQFKVQKNPSNLDNCQIVYVDENDSGGAISRLSGSGNSAALVVGEGEGFLSQGGMIAFVEQNNKVKLVINQRSALAAGLEIDSQLLEVALKVIK